MGRLQLADKTLDVLEAVAALGGASLPEIQARVGLPMTTTYRIVATLAARGFVMRCGRGSYRLGAAALTLAGTTSEHDLLAVAARLPLRALARKVRSHCHLGVFDGGMVTYLVKQRHGSSRLPSVEGSQLEAYCSALGKVLLAGLPDDAVARYLGDGSLVALTANTIVDPAALLHELAQVRARGWAIDDEEIVEGLRCVAVPLRRPTGEVVAAISVSTVSPADERVDPAAFLPALLDSARAIGRTLHPLADRQVRRSAERVCAPALKAARFDEVFRMPAT